jgi:hypothetical protein
MDDLERLVSVYRARASASVKSKLDVLMDVGLVRDARVAPFLLEVLSDRHEAEEVRIYVMKLLRPGGGVASPSDQSAAAQAVSDVLNDPTTIELRIQAALALGDFTRIDGVLATLASVSLAGEESIDLRYAAFTSVERAGPTTESIAALRQIARDDTLGGAARSVLSAWHVDELG